MNKDLLELAKRISKNPSTEQLEIPGFQYVPSLNLYVSNTVTHFDTKWKDISSILEDNEQILSLPEYGQYVTFLKDNRPELYSQTIENPNHDEWLNTVMVQDKQYINSPTYRQNNFEGSRTKCPGKEFYFNMDSFDKKGFPKKVRNGEWHLDYTNMRPSPALKAINSGKKTISFRYSINANDESIGIRIAKKL